jgi:hypothetical protein
MFKDITAAQVGSAVRWAVTTLSTLVAGQNWAAGADWTNIAAGLAAIAMLGWSFWSNTKKLA